jgi:uncharacterized membrane protein YjgN (DUF898 family)
MRATARVQFTWKHGRQVRGEAENTMSDSTVQTTTPETISFSFVKRKGLLKITIVSFLLSIITLGFYRFWAKTHVRKHIWSSVHINGEPLEYTGTGWELCKGFLVILGVFVLPLALLTGVISVVYGPESPLLALIQVLVFLFLYVFWGFAVYKARKFQLQRTNWRGIRGTLVGSAMTYSLLYFGSLLAKSASLGWATPVMNTVLQEQIVNDMRFGEAAFKFKGRAGPLYPTYALCWLLTVVGVIAAITVAATSTTLSGYLDQTFTGFDLSTDDWIGIIILVLLLGFVLLAIFLPLLWAVYIAKELRTFANYTRFDGAPFRLEASAWSVFWLTVVNILILIFTLGIFWPYINRRTVKFVVDRLHLDGHVDVDRIAQSSAKLETRGEGLADAFDVGGL